MQTSYRKRAEFDGILGTSYDASIDPHPLAGPNVESHGADGGPHFAKTCHRPGRGSDPKCPGIRHADEGRRPAGRMPMAGIGGRRRRPPGRRAPRASGDGPPIGVTGSSPTELFGLRLNAPSRLDRLLAPMEWGFGLDHQDFRCATGSKTPSVKDVTQILESAGDREKWTEERKRSSEPSIARGPAQRGKPPRGPSQPYGSAAVLHPCHARPQD